MKRALFLLAFLSFIGCSLNAQGKLFPAINISELHKQAVTPIIMEANIWSAIVKDNFRIFISLPENYDGYRKKKYPVLYFLDGGGTTFHNITAEYMQSGIIPDIITIGIGYPGATQRNRDYTYGFQNFYQFLKQELIPQIDYEFNTDTLRRTLFGHSFGGICTLLAMFQYTDYTDILFHNLIAASPSIWWPDGQQSFVYESSLYSKTSILPVNLYMTVGSLEGSMVSDLNRMDEVLESRNYEYFNIYSLVNEGEDHSSNKELTFRNGIKWILNQTVYIPSETNVGILAQGQKEINVSPNPVQGILKISLPNRMPERYTLEFISSSGKICFQTNTCEPEIKIDVSGFPKGIYIIKITGKEGLSTRKIMVN